MRFTTAATVAFAWVGMLTASVAANIVDFTQPYAVDPDTVALYHLDGNTNDAVGLHDATAHGDATPASGKFAGGYHFDGDGDYLRAGNVHSNTSFDTTQGTVEAWVQMTDAPNFFVVLGSGREYGSTWDDGFFLGRHASYGQNLMFGVWGPGWVYAHSNIDPASLVGEWHHMAGTWGPTRGMELWLDGVVVAAVPTYLGGLPNPNYETVLIGTDSWTWDTPGYIDEVRISDVQRMFVPEPGTLSLLALGGLALIRRRR